jgi:hypothetical protein
MDASMDDEQFITHLLGDYEFGAVISSLTDQIRTGIPTSLSGQSVAMPVVYNRAIELNISF